MPKFMPDKLIRTEDTLYIQRSDGERIAIPFNELELWEEELTGLLEIIRETIKQQRQHKQQQSGWAAMLECPQCSALIECRRCKSLEQQLNRMVDKYYEFAEKSEERLAELQQLRQEVCERLKQQQQHDNNTP